MYIKTILNQDGRLNSVAYYIFPNALSKEECKTYLDYCLDNVQLEQATTINAGATDTDQAYREITDKRNTSVGFLDYSHDLINDVVWGFIREANDNFFKYDLNFFQRIQFAKYEVGDYYNWHQDASSNRKTAEHRKLSLTMSLTDDTKYEGGHLQFFDGEYLNPDQPSLHKLSNEPDIERDIKSVGTVVVFDSTDWHRVTPVTKGIRYSLVCWCVGPNFI